MLTAAWPTLTPHLRPFATRQNATFSMPYPAVMISPTLEMRSLLKEFKSFIILLSSGLKTAAFFCPAATASLSYCLNQPCVRWQKPTNASINGTSINTPTTVAKAAPEDKPNNITAVAIATSK